MNAGFISGGTGASLTIDASSNITISSRHIEFDAGRRPALETNNLTLDADGSIFFRKDTTISDVY